MSSFILFCKSYRNDVLRVKKLCESIKKFNLDFIPFYLSVPSADIDLFKKIIDFESPYFSNNSLFHLITDEEIVAANPKSNIAHYKSIPGYISQQCIKAEAWRLLQCDNYLCLDSDSLFTKAFHLNDFFHSDGNPYTVIHDGTDLLTLANKLNKQDVLVNFYKDSNLLKHEFGREGADYDFGPTPVIWSSRVWATLDQEHLTPQQETIWDAFERLPMELRWYGESVLKYQAIPRHPIHPLFTCYHYEWQYIELQKNPPDRQKDSMGIVLQSNWDHSLQPKFVYKPWYSRLWKNLKQTIKKL
ncbi:MAG: hypothetical protein EBZ95_11330 [Chitinophagia bacterium]|nr:hypothetical protein [Chitinophagia bacterium]